jgi:hypothetical protein
VLLEKEVAREIRDVINAVDALRSALESTTTGFSRVLAKMEARMEVVLPLRELAKFAGLSCARLTSGPWSPCHGRVVASSKIASP